MGKSKFDHILSEICNSFEKFLLWGAIYGGAIVAIEQVIIWCVNQGIR